MQIRRLLVVACVLAVTGTVVFLPARAGNPVPDSACHEKCDENNEEEAAKCGKMATESERTKCQNEGYEHYKTCRAGCQEMLTKCEDKCHEEYNDKVKECNKVKDKDAKAKCQQVAAEQLGDCIQKCKKKK